ncbi:hypothetical protein HQ587_00560 [bacterium]|nr:hypothetical protein [bacterium]
MIVSFLLASCVWLAPLDATNVSVWNGASVSESSMESSSLIEGEILKSNIQLSDGDRKVGVLYSSYLTEKGILFRQWNSTCSTVEFNLSLSGKTEIDFKYLSGNESHRQDGFRRWIVPVMITIGAGVTVYALYSVRGR